MPILDYQFTLNSGNALPYSWSPAGANAINSSQYLLSNKKYEIGLATLFIDILGGSSPPATIAVSHQYQMDRDATYYAAANNVLSDVTDVSTYTIALSASTEATFKARLDIQTWWMFSVHGGRFVLTPSGAGDLTVREMRICGI